MSNHIRKPAGAPGSVGGQFSGRGGRETAGSLNLSDTVMTPSLAVERALEAFETADNARREAETYALIALSQTVTMYYPDAVAIEVEDGLVLSVTDNSGTTFVPEDSDLDKIDMWISSTVFDSGRHSIPVA